jgi:hypothetical protein
LCRDSPAFDFHPTLPGMLGTTLIRHQVVQVCEANKKRLLAATCVVKPLHHKQLPVDGVMRLIEQGAGDRHLRVFEYRIPARLLLLNPTPDARPVGRPCSVSHVIGKAAEPLTQCKHPQALALSCPVQQGVELGAQGLAQGGRDGREFTRELGDRMAETVAEACPREQRPQALEGAVEPSVRMARTRYDGFCWDAAR